jgi:hypothetical protein
MKLRCRKEVFKDNGAKLMEFTKDLIYDFEESGESGEFKVLDDNGKEERFFELRHIFEKL